MKDESENASTTPHSHNAVKIVHGLTVPSSEINFRFSRSGGKGGQNVNKVETKVELLFDVRRALSLTDVQRNHLLRRLASQLDANGILHITAQASRSQWQNREHAVGKFVTIIRKAMTPVKKRIKTKVSNAHKELRLREKKRRSEIKKMRRIDV